MSKNYDVIVVGLGGMGSAAAYQLSTRGQRVLGLDAHSRNHTLGSSHGRSRIIREAYAEAEEYVPLVRRSYELWGELEEKSGRDLLTITGGLVIGKPESSKVKGAVRSARRHGLFYELLSPKKVAERFPGFRLSDDLVAFLDPRAGILVPEVCVCAHLDVAASHGADLHHDEPVYDWEANGTGVRVETSLGIYEAERLVIATGPWAGELLNDLRLPLSVERIVNAHFEPLKPDLFAPERCPVYMLTVPEGYYYGFPLLPGQGLKVGADNGGETCTPHTIRREIEPKEIEEMQTVLERYMPGAMGTAKWAFTCMYTNTPDEHFIIDRHPQYERVVYGCGFSGKGFKFASVVGEVLADLATEGETRHPIGFLSASRFRSLLQSPEPRFLYGE